MSTERNKQVVRDLIEAHFRDDRPKVAELLSPKLVWHMAGQPSTLTREDYLTGLAMGQRAFSEMAHTVDQLIGEGDRIAVLSTIRMRHTGQFQDLAPTNRKVEFGSLWMYRVADDRVVEIWSFEEDFTGKLR